MPPLGTAPGAAVDNLDRLPRRGPALGPEQPGRLGRPRRRGTPGDQRRQNPDLADRRGAARRRTARRTRVRLIINHDGTKIYTADDAGTYLTDANDNVILLSAAQEDGTRHRISRRSPAASTSTRMPATMRCRRERMSVSALERRRVHLQQYRCVCRRSRAGSNSYKYFTYTCYVGPGWYGNVGVSRRQQMVAGDPTICVGDPGFNGGVSNSTTDQRAPGRSRRADLPRLQGHLHDQRLPGVGPAS